MLKASNRAWGQGCLRCHCSPDRRSQVSRRRLQRCALKALPRDDDIVDEHLPTCSEMITFFTSDGIVTFPSRYGSVKRPNRRAPPPMPSWDEQKLCIGASFLVAATNGHNPTRRVNIQGFCQSVDMLFESVEDVVMLRGGEILDEQRQLKSGLHEELRLIVAIPLLWGVPPTLDCLKSAIVGGGGIVDRINHRWDMWAPPQYNHHL